MEVLAERFDLDPTRRIAALSHGNVQKVGIVQAFMHRPDLLVLDEPTTGLDPIMQQEFLSLLLETSRRRRRPSSSPPTCSPRSRPSPTRSRSCGRASW